MIRSLIVASALAALASCATQPEPCTPEWAQWKSDKILRGFAIEHRGFIRDLRKIEGSLQNPGPLQAMRLIGMADDAADVIEDFRDDIVPELRSAYAECGSVDKLMPTFTKFLRQEGVSEETLRWVESLAAFAETFQTSRAR